MIEEVPTPTMFWIANSIFFQFKIYNTRVEYRNRLIGWTPSPNKTWLNESWRAKSPDWLNSQAQKTWLGEIQIGKTSDWPLMLFWPLTLTHTSNFYFLFHMTLPTVEEINIFQINLISNINIHILCQLTFFWYKLDSYS
jgi:hypothetical protein